MSFDIAPLRKQFLAKEAVSASKIKDAKRVA
jgi:hypothetical protein